MNNFSYLLKQGLSSVWKNRFMSFASFCILTVSLLLVGLSAFIMLDCGIILDNVSDKNEISVYMEDEADINHIRDVLKSNSLVINVRYISPEEGLQSMKEQYKDQTELFDSLPYNPVPPTYMVTINDLDKIDMAVSQFQAIQGVYKVNAPMDFASFIEDIRNTFTIIGIALMISLGAVSIIIIANTTRLSVFARRKEIAIMRIVGATNSFIRTPFFIEGMSIGLVSGLMSWILTKLIYEGVFTLFSENLGMWSALGMDNIIKFSDVSIVTLLVYCGAGALLGAIGTVFSMGKHLKI
ncbi:MAG: ABC transporter permease [Ruminiclostridium sp.]|nr:ABC transporter permease [Ruminiclostridium sp.]